MNLSTRTLKAAEVNPGITSAMREFLPIFGSGNQGAFDEDRLRVVASASCNRLVVCSDTADVDRVIGTGLLTIYPTPTNNRAEITCLAVLPEYRGNGIGKLVLDKCYEDADSALVNSLYLSTGSGNDAARRLFEDFGFTQVSDASSGLVEYECDVQQGARF